MSPRSEELSQAMRAHSRAALLNAARKLFAEQGYFQTRMTDIAQEAEMSTGNVYWYFSSKEDLLKAVLADGFDTLGDILQDTAASPGSAVAKLDMLVARLLSYGHERWEFNTIMLSLLGQGGDERFRELGFDMEQIGLGYTQDLSRILAQAQAEGSLPSEHDPRALSMLFFGLFNGMNLTYGKDWLELPHDFLQSALFRLLHLSDRET